jgi:hypothetical protein
MIKLTAIVMNHIGTISVVETHSDVINNYVILYYDACMC